MRHREQTDTAIQDGAAPLRAFQQPAAAAAPSFCGVDFASQDCLGLSTHPAIVETAAETLRRLGVRSVCSSSEPGEPGLSIALERCIADFLEMEDAMLCPTGQAAGHAVIRGLVRPSDHVVIDENVRGGLREAAEATTRHLHPFRHLDAEQARTLIRAIRAGDARGGILLVTESLSPLDSGTPDLAALRAICDEYDATLLVDVSQDLGCLGEDGRGHLSLQDMLGRVDLVTGGFSRSFATNGGFVAARTRTVTSYLRVREAAETALSPIQTAVILKAFALIDAADGRERRAKLMRNVLTLRAALRERGLRVCGEPSATVSVRIGSNDLAHSVCRELSERGLLLELAAPSEAGRDEARLRLHVTAGHNEADTVRAATWLAEALQRAGSNGSLVSSPSCFRVAA